MFAISVCSEGKNEDLLHEVILVVGYFTVLNNDNQVGNQIFFGFNFIAIVIFCITIIILYFEKRTQHDDPTRSRPRPLLVEYSALTYSPLHLP